MAESASAMTVLGVIGGIGVSHSMRETEQRSLRAAAAASLETGLAVHRLINSEEAHYVPAKRAKFCCVWLGICLCQNRYSTGKFNFND
ncbi:MAG: hypothetical protein LBR44_04255 [Clostridiales Family XIII bacterium]|nr:hypothetical protein [Clostridiales Family XIII bacterium]